MLCDFTRYPVYIDAGAYSSSLKQKLAQGSPLLMVKHRCRCCYAPGLQCAPLQRLPSTARCSMLLLLLLLWWSQKRVSCCESLQLL